MTSKIKDRFELIIENSQYKFEVHDDGLVWLQDDNDVKSKSNYGQTSPATSTEDARRIAKLMLIAMGKVKTDHNKR